eukprot:CAMPEP_0178426376 /NCGR_PEP_ID=MMETSP0689_2-20121128/29203_1 /TAXON_ID=160604 /ORGANISM="Amphidinium massartii, Strain CS-259" /LENGTH=452 /DNA_ID=CAMNT_0020048061 /DNA_START=45 /DNA_END=1403 /DNA_ORIENTATION=+
MTGLRLGALLSLAVVQHVAATVGFLRRNDSDALQVGPLLVNLRRESVPVYRRGEVVSEKNSYSGVVTVGSPAQEFRVVFDTGSGHVVVPAEECNSDSCVVHRRYSASASTTSELTNQDGSRVVEDEPIDQVTIGYGTGEVLGEFVCDKVCLGTNSGFCLDMQLVMAVEMSTRPFKTFAFDGIMGMGLPALSLNKKLSFLESFGRLHPNRPRSFGVYLSSNEGGEGSELSLGGFNSHHMSEPVRYVPVSNPDLGYWQVAIKAVRVGGVLLDVCADGMCRGILDSGTSHLGVPGTAHGELENRLQQDAGQLLDCRLVSAPSVEIELENLNLTVHAATYMRRMPLSDDDATMSSTAGISAAREDLPRKPVVQSRAAADGVGIGSAKLCTPRLVPVNMPEPLGPKLFILGEPVLHQYYTVYDWGKQEVGFALAAAPGKLTSADAIGDEAPRSEYLL